MSQALEEGVKEVISWLKQGKEFVVGEAPEVVKQLLQYEAFCAKIWIGINAPPTIIGVILFVRGLYIDPSTCEDVQEWGVVGLGMLLICGLIVTMHFLDLWKIKKTPKLFIFDYFRD